MKKICITSLEDLTVVSNNNFQVIAEGFKDQSKINRRNKLALGAIIFSLYYMSVRMMANDVKVKRLAKEIDELRYKNKGEDKEA